MKTNATQIFYSKGWKVIQPMIGISKFLYFFITQTKALHNLPLVFCTPSFCHSFALKIRNILYKNVTWHNHVHLPSSNWQGHLWVSTCHNSFSVCSSICVFYQGTSSFFGKSYPISFPIFCVFHTLVLSFPRGL